MSEVLSRPTNSATKRGSFVSNATFTILSLALGLAIAFWFTPYLIHHLGKERYGLVPLAITIVAYLGIFTESIGAAVSRSVATAIERDDVQKATRIFNTAQIALWVISIGLIGPILSISYFGDKIVRVPYGAESDVRLLFLLCGIAFLISTATSTFSFSTFCKNRLDMAVWFSMVSSLVRVGVVVLAFEATTAQLWFVGVGVAASALVSGLGFLWGWRRLTPDIKLSMSSWNPAELRNIASTAGWVSVSQIGTILLISIDLLVVNRILGPVAGSHYAISVQWSIMLRSIGFSLSNLFAPSITSLLARGEINSVVTYSTRSIKFIGLVMALPVGLISGSARPLLEAWVGSEYVDSAPLLALLTLPMAVNLAYLPLHQITLATNNVRFPGLVQIAAGVVNLTVAIVLAQYTALGVYGVALAGVVVLSGRNLLFTPLYAAHILKVPYFTFYRAMRPSLIACLAAFSLPYLADAGLHLQGWIELSAVALVTAVLYCCLCYLVLLSDDERREVSARLMLFGRGLRRQGLQGGL